MRMPPAKRTGIQSDSRSDSASKVRVSAAIKSTAPLMRPRGPFPQRPEACSSRPGIADASALTFPRPYATSAGHRTIAKRSLGGSHLTLLPGQEKPIFRHDKALETGARGGAEIAARKPRRDCPSDAYACGR